MSFLILKLKKTDKNCQWKSSGVFTFFAQAYNFTKYIPKPICSRWLNQFWFLLNDFYYFWFFIWKFDYLSVFIANEEHLNNTCSKAQNKCRKKGFKILFRFEILNFIQIVNLKLTTLEGSSSWIFNKPYVLLFVCFLSNLKRKKRSNQEALVKNFFLIPFISTDSRKK